MASYHHHILYAETFTLKQSQHIERVSKAKAGFIERQAGKVRALHPVDIISPPWTIYRDIYDKRTAHREREQDESRVNRESGRHDAHTSLNLHAIYHNHVLEVLSIPGHSR